MIVLIQPINSMKFIASFKFIWPYNDIIGFDNCIESPMFTYFLVCKFGSWGGYSIWNNQLNKSIFCTRNEYNASISTYNLRFINLGDSNGRFEYTNGAGVIITGPPQPWSTVINTNFIIAMSYGQSSTILRVYDNKANNMTLLVHLPSIRFDFSEPVLNHIAICNHTSYSNILNIYDFRIYNKELTELEINPIISALKVQFNNLP